MADRRSPSLAGWGEPAAAGTGRFDLHGTEGRYVLVWFTALPATDGGYRLDVAEIKVNT